MLTEVVNNYFQSAAIPLCVSAELKAANNLLLRFGKDLKDHQVQPQPDHITLTSNNSLLNHVPFAE